MTGNFSLPFAQLSFAYLWWISFFLLFLLKSPLVKGWLEEKLISLLVRIFLEKKRYYLYDNVILPTENGTTQIDHIIVSRYGIFVIETKNMKGWIFGDSQRKIWTQKIFRHTNTFQNPLHQNYKHTESLRTILQLENDALFSLVVFVGDATFKPPIPNNVVYAGGCIGYIKSKAQP